MAHFKDLNSLFAHLQNHVIPDILEKEVFDTVTQVQSRKVQEEVYSVYDPTHYQRRGWVGGLADPNNNIATFSYRVNSVSMFLQNATRGEHGYYIAPVIEYGHGNRDQRYEYTKYENGKPANYMLPRPFISETIRYLEASLAHVDAFRRGLKRHGIRTYK